MCPDHSPNQGVAGSSPGPATFFHWDLVMKIFLRPFSPFCWFKKGSCQLPAKEWALSILVNCIGGLPRNSVARLTDRARNYPCKTPTQPTNQIVHTRDHIHWPSDMHPLRRPTVNAHQSSHTNAIVYLVHITAPKVLFLTSENEISG